MPTQKAAKEAERIRIVLSTEAILTTTGGDEPVANLRVTKEVLQANCTNLTLVEERAKA
jgi:hypothetical protein